MGSVPLEEAAGESLLLLSALSAIRGYKAAVQTLDMLAP